MQLIHIETSGPLPTSTYHLMKGENHIGVLQIRHKSSQSKTIPPGMASHIYYEIDPKYREKGYGTELLRLGLIEARRIGIINPIATVWESNHASKRIIEKNGGALVESKVDPEKTDTFHKFVFS